jgi:transposase-like protein
LLAERNISVSYEAIRLWVNKFGPEFARRLKKRHQGFGDTYFLDEVFVKIGGKQHYLWRAVDQSTQALPKQKALQAIPNSILRDLGCGNSTLSEKLVRH